jgi:hypothetical protein
MARKPKVLKRTIRYEYETPYHVTDDEFLLADDGSLECCSCGLVHTVSYRLDNGKIYVSMTVDEKATKAARHERIEKEPVR